jgi:hypothetical protein
MDHPALATYDLTPMQHPLRATMVQLGVAIGGGATSDAIYENSATIAEDITIATGRNGMSTGPISVAGGVTVTVESGARYVVI